MDWGALDRLILDAELSGHKIGVTIIAPNQATYRYRGDEGFLAASTIKIAVMVSIFQKVDQGELSLERCIVVRREDKVPGSGVLQGIHDDVALNRADPDPSPDGCAQLRQGKHRSRPQPVPDRPE